MWRVVYQPEALKTLRRLDRKTVAPILDKLSEPAQDPHALNNNVKPLKGVNRYRCKSATGGPATRCRTML